MRHRYARHTHRGILPTSGVALVEKMIQSMKSRCHILFTDTALNGDDRVYANVYTSFVVAALKFSAYLAELRRFGITFTAEYLLKAIRRLVTFTSRYIGSRAASATAKLNPTAKGDKNVRLGGAERGLQRGG